MLNRSIRLVTLLALFGLAVFWLALRLQPSDRISREGFDRIQQGMTQEEVEAVLGVPPGEYVTEETRERLRQRSLRRIFFLQKASWRAERWLGDRNDACVRIIVAFNEQGLVADKDFEECFECPSLITRVRRWLEVQPDDTMLP